MASLGNINVMLGTVNRHADRHCETTGGLILIINEHIAQEHGFCTGRNLNIHIAIIKSQRGVAM